MATRSDARPIRHAAAAIMILVLAVPCALGAQQSAVERAVAGLEWRELGPTIMSGRVADLAVVESDPSTFYVGTATGGVWKTVNAGITFEALFTDEATSSIGDVTVAPSNPNVVWVGTGEPQNRQSSPWGNGVYKSTDAGRTWTHMGLSATHHIARIQIHPRNPRVVYVAAAGHLWGPNPERGVYRTTDGGSTWDLVLHVDQHTGAIDLVMDPGDPETLFAATYQRQRTGWGFNGGGPGGGIYRTTDGGDTWTELTEGLPEGDKGRIGLDVYRRDGNLVYAIVEADARSPGQGFGGGGGGGQNGVYRSTDRGDTWEQVSTVNNRPMYYSQIRIDPNDPERIYTGGSDLYKSSDGGRTFTNDAAEGVHLDHHALWIDPSDSDHLILGSDGGVSVSWDRTDNWYQLLNLPISQFYEIGVDHRDPYHVCGGLQDNGSWCAPSDTWSNQGIRTRDWYNVGSGDGFYTVMHPENARLMFAESQGGNLTRVDLETGERLRMRPIGRPDADGEDPDLRWNWNAPVVLSSHDPNTVYFGAQVVFKSTDLGMSWEAISPDLTHAIDRTELEIMGVRGSEPMMSANDGTSSYGNLITISESPLDPNLLYAGSDDGRVHVTRDGGATWSDVTAGIPGLPPRTYVARLVASHGAAGTVYAAFDGHRNDDFAAYVYVSDDFGRSWRRITNGLPATSVNTVAQHPRTANLLFVGNEVGIWFSVNGGAAWTELDAGLPTVPVDDIEIQERENDLVIGTHGRGIWIMSDVTPLEQLTPQVLAADLHLFPVRRATIYNPYRPQGWTPGIWVAENPPAGALIRYHVGPNGVVAVDAGANGDGVGEAGRGGPSANGPADAGAVGAGRAVADGGVTVTILDGSGAVLRTLEGPAEPGLHQVVWDLRLEPPFVRAERGGGGGGGGGFGGGQPEGPRVLPGTYEVRVGAGGVTASAPVEVRLDPRVQITRADLLARQELLMSAYALAGPQYEAGQAVERVTRQLDEIGALLEDAESAPAALVERVEDVRERVREIGRELNEAGGGRGGGLGAAEGSHTRPTADQLWQLERAWERVPPLIERLNAIISSDLSDINRQLNENGVRPDPGDPVPLPRRPGGA